MNKTHCDRCDVIIVTDRRDPPFQLKDRDSDNQHYFNFDVVPIAGHRHLDFCKRCWAALLTEYVKMLEGQLAQDDTKALNP